MPVVEILASPERPAVKVTASGPLVDVCDEARAAVDFACRGSTCGTCRIEVLAGADLLAPPGADEVSLLRALAASPGQRLACQAVLRAGPGLVRLRWVGR